MKHDKFLSLSILSDLWKGIICDYIINLSLSNDFDVFLIFINPFTKMMHLIPYNKTIDTPLFLWMFLDHIIYLYNISDLFISDQDSIFISHFWKYLIKFLDINDQLSIFFNSQMDSQTEYMNQIVK